jgi:hypothetical protein
LRVDTLHGVGQYGQMRFAVDIVATDRLAPVTALGGAIDHALELDAGGSGGQRQDLTPSACHLPICLT